MKKTIVSLDITGDGVQGEKEDRISALPRNVIDRILELLPAQDTARTSALSKKWRYYWSMLPYLVFDNYFCDDLMERSQSFFIQTVYNILLLHRGDIVKFVLDVPEAFLHTDSIDKWMLYVTRNGVKELSLYITDIVYNLPSYVFNCTTLTCLKLFNCVFKPPNSFLGFPKLETLYLEGVVIVPTTDACVLNVPRLVYLDLSCCHDTQFLKILSPLLEELCVVDFHYFVLNYIMNCKSLRVLKLRIYEVVEYDERSTLEKLLLSLAPTLEKLELNSFLLEFFSADSVPKGPQFMYNNLWCLHVDVDFGKLRPTAGTLQLIKSIPNLRNLRIWNQVTSPSNNAEAVSKYLNTAACLDQPLNKLKHVVIHLFQGSKTELLFLKLLLSRAPSLVRMSIEQQSPGPRKERTITTELIGFPKASPNAEIYY